MKFKNIKLITKTLIITTIIILSSVNMAFADDNIKTIQDFCNKYGVEYNGKVDTTPMFYMVNDEKLNDGTEVVKFSNGSLYVSNKNNGTMKFKPIESNMEIDLNTNKYIDVVNDYKKLFNNKNSFTTIKDDFSFFNNIGSHNNKVYTSNLKNDENLNIYAKKWLNDNYNMELNIPIRYTKIEKTINNYCGYFYNKDSKALRIDISQDIRNFDIISERILIHELTHYALFELNKPFHDNDKYFINEALKNGATTNDGGYGEFHSNLECTLINKI